MRTGKLEKYFRGEASEIEEAAIVEWANQSKENMDTFLNERMIFDAILFSDTKSKKNIFSKNYIIYTLSAVASIFAIAFFITLFHKQDAKLELLSQKIHIPAGQRAKIDLPDGTIAWVNSQTTITYSSDFGLKERIINLDGEAYFEVSHNEQIPFYVVTEELKIQVTGTKFDVCAYKGSNYFITRLLEGSINVLKNNEESNPLISLTKGKFFSANNGNYKTGLVANNNSLAWIDGIYYFDDVPFEDLLDKISLYYNYEITVTDPKILENYNCTGKFKDVDGIEHILKVIQKDHFFKYKIDNDKNQITIY